MYGFTSEAHKVHTFNPIPTPFQSQFFLEMHKAHYRYLVLSCFILEVHKAHTLNPIATLFQSHFFLEMHKAQNHYLVAALSLARFIAEVNSFNPIATLSMHSSLRHPFT